VDGLAWRIEDANVRRQKLLGRNGLRPREKGRGIVDAVKHMSKEYQGYPEPAKKRVRRRRGFILRSKMATNL